MKRIISVLLCASMLLCHQGIAQNANTMLLREVPTSEEGFVATEKQLLATIAWLENTPSDQEMEKRDQQKALLLGWLINSPTVSLEVNAEVVKFSANPELLLFFLAGWGRYAIENNYSNDAVAGSVAGLKSAINIYKRGGLKADDEMDKLVEMDKKGTLVDWVKSQLSK